jgi:hypothetical protein
VTASTDPQKPDHQTGRSELRRRRDALAEEVAELQWALGGLTYEMAIRDHFRMDVLLRRAALLQERDAELAEVERLLHMQESSVAGNCASCGAVRSRGAVYCWQCGAAVMERSPIVSEAVATELGTAVSGKDGAPLPPPDSDALTPERALDPDRQDALTPERALHPDRQDTLVAPPEPERRVGSEQDAFGRSVSAGR